MTSGNWCDLSLPLRVMSLTLDPDANASTRTPSYLGSNVHSSPVGISVPIDASIGVIAGTRDSGTGNASARSGIASARFS